MKYLFLLIPLLLAFQSCKSNDKVDIDDFQTVDTLDAAQKFLQEQLATISGWQEIMKGNWYLSDYLDEVKFSQSPFKVSTTFNGIMGFSINNTPQFSEKTQSFGAFTIHEGGIKIQFKIVEGKLVFHFDDTDKTPYEVLEVNEEEILAENSASGKVISLKKYKDARNAMASLLFNGNYEVMESGRKIEVRADGTISGWPSFDHFYIPFDYVGLTDFDCVLFTKTPNASLKDHTLYQATFTERLITLVKYIPDWNTLNHEETNEVLRLKKI